MNYEQELLQKVRKLNGEQKQRVLEYVEKQLSPIKGTPGKLALQYAREIDFSREDLAEMQAAIEEAFETIDDFPDVDLDK